MSIQTLEKMVIGPETLLKPNPRLIYGHASGRGRKGKEGDNFFFDYTGIARCGLIMAAGEPGDPSGQLLPGIGDESGDLMFAWLQPAPGQGERTKKILARLGFESGEIIRLGSDRIFC